MPKKRTIPILFLLLCTCGVDPAERPAAEEPAADELTTSYEALSVAERAVIDHERATAKNWGPVNEGFSRAVRDMREAGR